MELKSYIIEEKENLVQLRRWFHQHPEGSMKEYLTRDKIEKELDAIGIIHKRVGETGVFAVIKGELGEGKVIALRADIDALAIQDEKSVEYRSLHDGYAHACGHDAHCATLLCAAKILQQRKHHFKGEIRFFFQQGEEIGQGARKFIEMNLLDGVERIYGAHMCSSIDVYHVSLTPGPINASCDYFKITVKGKGSHVSQPQNGVDALYIASMIVVNLQSIVARMTSPTDSVIVGVGKLSAGTQYNSVAQEAILEGTTRSFSFETRSKVNYKVEAIAKQIGKLYGAKVNVEFQNFAFPLVNDADVVNEVSEIAENMLGKDHVIHNQEKMLQADDFAAYLEQTKGVYAYIGSRNAAIPNTCSANHHGLFDIDEDALLVSLQLYVEYALSYLSKRNFQ